jgi:2,4-dienoyl-CoA reductase-like NADH-dependent reductase (Old Yellow Enzyme family)
MTAEQLEDIRAMVRDATLKAIRQGFDFVLCSWLAWR